MNNRLTALFLKMIIMKLNESKDYILSIWVQNAKTKKEPRNARSLRRSATTKRFGRSARRLARSANLYICLMTF